MEKWKSCRSATSTSKADDQHSDNFLSIVCDRGNTPLKMVSSLMNKTGVIVMKMIEDFTLKDWRVFLQQVNSS